MHGWMVGLAAVWVAGACPPGPGSGLVVGAAVEREAALMGTALTLRVLAADRGTALAASESALAAVGRVEDLLSTWRTDTELARLNVVEPGTPVVVSDSLLLWLVRARELWRATDGAFDPAVGALIDAWALRGEGRIPSDAALDSALAATGFGRIRIDTVAGTWTRLRERVWVDAGGFGKGAALDAALWALCEADASGAVLDFGGQVAVLAGAAAVPVASPVARDAAVAVLRLASGSVATTAASERRRIVDGQVLGHVLDPRTGRPVPAWGSVTVVAPDAFTADALATALFVLGPDRALSWAAGRDVGVLVLESLENGLYARWNHAMAEWLECVDTVVETVDHAPRCAPRATR